MKKGEIKLISLNGDIRSKNYRDWLIFSVIEGLFAVLDFKLILKRVSILCNDDLIALNFSFVEGGVSIRPNRKVIRCICKVNLYK